MGRNGRYDGPGVGGGLARGALVAGLLLLPIVGAGRRCIAFEGDAELLRLVRNGYQANVEKVTTWQGSAEIETHTENIGFDKRTIRSHVDFVYDRDQHAARWNWRSIDDSAIVGDQQKDLSEYIVNKMVKGDRLYRFGPFEPERQDHAYVLNVNSKAGFRPVNTSDDFDVMAHLTHPRGTHMSSLVEMLDHYYGFTDESDWPARVAQEGSRVIFEIKTDVLVNHYEFDLSQGCTLVRYFGSGMDVTDEWTYEYEQQDGAFVPRRYVYKNVNTKEPQRPRTRVRKTVFTRNVVNQPVPPSEFDIAKLGVQPGDAISDRLIGVTYGYKSHPALSMDQDVLLADAADETLPEEGPDVTKPPGPQQGSPGQEAVAETNAPPAVHETVAAKVEPTNSHSTTTIALVFLVALSVVATGAIIAMRNRAKEVS